MGDGAEEKSLGWEKLGTQNFGRYRLLPTVGRILLTHLNHISLSVRTAIAHCRSISDLLLCYQIGGSKPRVHLATVFDHATFRRRSNVQLRHKA